MKTLGVLLLLALSQLSLADSPSLHGMLLFGEKAQYVSHLPMFHRPHDYQAIAQVSLGSDTEIYLNDLATSEKGTLYTLAPEVFSLPERFKGGETFQATLFRGHFERGGTPLKEVTVQISNVIHFRKFSPDAVNPKDYTALAFGSVEELFLAHKIHRAPDFDQIIPAKVQGNPKDVLAVGEVSFSFPNSQPLKKDACLPARFGKSMVRMILSTPLYTEVDELKH